MKKIFFVLAAMVGLNTTAGAQEGKYAKNYKICRSDTGYLVCPDQSVTNLNDPAPPTVRGRKIPAWQQNSFVAPANGGRAAESEGVPTREALENSYPQKESQMEQNNRRNLNSGNNKYLSPSTGEVR